MSKGTEIIIKIKNSDFEGESITKIDSQYYTDIIGAFYDSLYEIDKMPEFDIYSDCVEITILRSGYGQRFEP